MVVNILLLFLVVTFSALNELLAFGNSQNPDKPRQDLKQYFSLCDHSLHISCSRQKFIKVLRSRCKSAFQFLPSLTSSKHAASSKHVYWKKELPGCLMSVFKGVKN